MFGKLHALFSRDLAFLFQVALVSHQNLAHTLVCKSIDLMHPLSHIVEGLSVCNVVHNYNALSTSVVRGGQCSESFLSGGVPNLKLDHLVFHLNCLYFLEKVSRDLAYEIYSDCVEEIFIEMIFLSRKYY